MSWSNSGNPSQDPVTTNLPNAIGSQTTHNTHNIPLTRSPTINTPPTTTIPSIPIPSFEQVLASTLQHNNVQQNNLLPSFSTFLTQLPPLPMNPYDSRTYPPNTVAWNRPYGISYTPAPQRTTVQTSPSSSASQYYSVIPAKRVHPESNRSDRHTSDDRYSGDNYSSRHSSSRGSSSSDRNHYDSSKRHRSGSERSTTSGLRPSSSSYSSSHSSSSRRGDHAYTSSGSRSSSTPSSHGSARSSSSQPRQGNVNPPPPPPPAAKSTGVLSSLNGRVTIDRFQEYARLVGAYPYLRNLLHDVPSQFELSNDPAYQAMFELTQPGFLRLIVKRVSIDLPDEVYNKIKANAQLRIHVRTFLLKDETTEHSWPASTQLLVNNNTVSIVSKANDKKLQDLPADITPYCRPGLNFIDFTSYPQEHHVVVIQVVRLISAEELFDRKKEDVQPYDKMFQKVLDFFHAGDSEIAATRTKVSLIDALSLQRIQIPTRASTCLPHLQCFDLCSYIMANYKFGKWQCPVCSKKAAYKNLFVDSYTQRILTELAEQQKLSSTREVEIHPDGTWNRVDEDQKKRFESVKLDDFKTGFDGQSSPSRSSGAKKNNVIQVINLDSDEEDEEKSYSASAPSNGHNKVTVPVIKDEFSNGSADQSHYDNALDTIATVATSELRPIMQEPSYNNEDVHNSSGDFTIDLNAPDLDYFDFGVGQASSYQNNNTNESQYVNTAAPSKSGAMQDPIVLDDD